jgi:hypothetical protein
MWFLRWTAFALTHSRNPLVTDRLNAPYGVNLMWNASMPLVGLVFAPLTLTAGAAFAYNAWITLSVAASGWCAYLLAKRWTTSQVASIVGGLVYGFSPYVHAQAYGHSNLTAVFIPPLLFLLLVDALVDQRHPPWATGLGIGLLAAAQLLISEELLADEVVVGAVALVVLAMSHREKVTDRAPRALRTFAVAAATFGALAAWPLLVQFLGPRHITGGTVQPPDVYVSDAAGFILPTQIQRFAPHTLVKITERFTGNGAEWNAYVGVPLLVVLVAWVAVGGRRSPLVRFLGVMALATGVLSLGPHLHVAGRVTGIPLPWSLAAKLPLLGHVLPGRLMLCVDLFAATLVALFLDASLRMTDWRRLAGVLATALALAPLLPARSLPARPNVVPSFFDNQVRRISPGSVVLVAPFARAPWSVEAMLWQQDSDMRFRMPEGYFIGPDASGRPVTGPAPTATAALMTTAAGGRTIPVTETVRRSVVRDLRVWGVETIIVGPFPHADVVADLFTHVLGRPPQRVGGCLVWWSATVT